MTPAIDRRVFVPRMLTLRRGDPLRPTAIREGVDHLYQPAGDDPNRITRTITR
jgi:hypothetical protein